MKIKNKGLSPLIATVVLITLVVVIAGIIYQSGNEFLAQLSPPADCTGISFDAGIFQEDDGSNNLELENKGIKIESLILEITSESTGQSDNRELSLSANSGESVRQKIDFEIPQDSIVKIIPQVKNAEDTVSPCPEEFGKTVEIIVS